MSTAGTGADPGAAGGGSDTPFKVFKTESEFQEHINATEAKARQIAERRIKSVTADERATMDAMAAELEARKQRDLEAEGNYAKAKEALEKSAAERVAKEAEKRTKAEAALRKTVIEDQLKALAAVHGAYDPEDVVVRLKDRITLDDEYAVRVLDASGGSVQDGVTMEQAVIDLLKLKPHLVKATGGGKGSGAAGGASLGSGFTGTPSQREAQERLARAADALKANPGALHLRSEYLAAQQAANAAKVAS